MIGVVKEDSNYNVFARQNIGVGFIALESPSENLSENMNVGYGMNINIYKNLSFTPIYMIPLKEDEEGGRDGSFKVGVSYNL